MLTVAPDPSATTFGVDFNPAANALRIVSNTGQNLRQSFVNLGTTTLTPTATDTPLNYTPGTPAMGVVAVAYTNNDLAAATATSLFALDAVLAQIALQSPANSGMLAATGKLGVTPSAGGLDIYSMLRDNVTVSQRALASLVVDGSSGLYDVNLLTGKATLRGGIDASVIDIAVPLNQL